MTEADRVSGVAERTLQGPDNQEIHIKDLEDLVLEGQSWSSLRFDKLARVFGRRFSLPDCNDPRLVGSFPVLEWAKAPKTSYEPSVIYCTWAAAGNNVNIEFVKKQLKSFERLQINPDIFIVDAGWFTSAGDWFSVDKRKFPRGLEEVAEVIHDSGIEPWIWWGPFNVDRKSHLAREHPDWLVKKIGRKNPAIFKFTQTSISPPHFILDSRHPEARRYMRSVVEQIKDWGFEGVKADFLSNAFFVPGEEDLEAVNQLQALTYIHDLLEEIKKSGLSVLACGCPFTAALGVADFIRVSNDSGVPAGMNSKVSRQINHVLVEGVDRGVRQRTSLVKEFGINPDPDMFYQFDLGESDAERLIKIQEYSIRNGGCLTLGDDFNKLTPEQIAVVRQLVSLFDSVNAKE